MLDKNENFHEAGFKRRIFYLNHINLSNLLKIFKLFTQTLSQSPKIFLLPTEK